MFISNAFAAEAATAVHSKRNLQGSAIEDVLGVHASKQLLKGSVGFAGIRLHLVTAKVLGSLQRGPMVEAYVSPWLLAQFIRGTVTISARAF